AQYVCQHCSEGDLGSCNFDCSGGYIHVLSTGRITVMIYECLAAIMKSYKHDEYIWAAVELYIDIINLFMGLLTFFRAADHLKVLHQINATSLSGTFDIETGTSGNLNPTMTESPLRWGFIQKVYAILTIQLLFMVAVGGLVVEFHPFEMFLMTTIGGLACYWLLLIIPFFSKLF
nr:BI1-like protein [Tanacetum cinerariifolium]